MRPFSNKILLPLSTSLVKMEFLPVDTPAPETLKKVIAFRLDPKVDLNDQLRSILSRLQELRECRNLGCSDEVYNEIAGEGLFQQLEKIQLTGSWVIFPETIRAA